MDILLEELNNIKSVVHNIKVSKKRIKSVRIANSFIEQLKKASVDINKELNFNFTTYDNQNVSEKKEFSSFVIIEYFKTKDRLGCILLDRIKR